MRITVPLPLPVDTNTSTVFMLEKSVIMLKSDSIPPDTVPAHTNTQQIQIKRNVLILLRFIHKRSLFFKGNNSETFAIKVWIKSDAPTDIIGDYVYLKVDVSSVVDEAKASESAA